MDTSTLFSRQIAAVLVFTPDFKAALDWYEKAFTGAIRVHLDAWNHTILKFGDSWIEPVRADAKVGAGPAGSVVYWQVTDFDRALEHMQSVGATLYRGPMDIENGEAMCQVRDPWGNCIGLRGQRSR